MLELHHHSTKITQWNGIVFLQMDMIEQYGELAFGLDFYTEVQDLSYLARAMQGTGSAFSKRFERLTQGLCEVSGKVNIVKMYSS